MSGCLLYFDEMFVKLCCFLQTGRIGACQLCHFANLVSCNFLSGIGAQAW